MMTAKRTAPVVLGVLVLAVVAICQTNAVRVHEPARRLALVIGNAAYADNPLANPEGDAQLIETTLEGLGFDEVVRETNLETKDALLRAVREFGRRLRANDLAFFYYSGHGQQAPGGIPKKTQNYLLPTGYDRMTPLDEVEYEALSFERVRRMLERAQLRVLVLDACRKYKLGKSDGGGGLAPTVAARGELIAYATEADAVATDEGEGAGIYAQELAGALRQRGLEVGEVFRNVMAGVDARTKGAQHPVYMPRILGRLYLNGPPETIDSGEQDGDPSPPAAGSSWKSPLGMEFAWVPAGEFEMGSPGGEAGRDDDEVQHGVRISEGFWMGRYEVTQGEWEAVMGANPSYFESCGARCPVEQVSWFDAQEFIRKLNRRESGSGYEYRLPTEAEWEYAARAGSAGATPEGELRILGSNNAPELDGQAWYGGNSGVSYAGGYDCSDWEGKQYAAERCGTHPVGLKRGNGWGLHDMLGNVWEWTGDWFGDYPSGTVTDPRGPSTGSYRVARGGGWYGRAGGVRSAARGYGSPGNRHYAVGFRLVRTE